MKWNEEEAMKETSTVDTLNSSDMAGKGMSYKLTESSGFNTSSLVTSYGQDIVLYSICCAMALTIIVGTIGNLMVVLAVRTNKKLQTISNVFVVNLSVCDLLFVAVVLPFNIYTYIADGWFLDTNLCKFIGFLGYTLTGTTIITITMISWNRYELVVNQHVYTQTFSKRRIVLMLIGTWVMPVICLFPAIIEIWGQFGFVPMLVACNLLLNHESQSFKLFLLVVRAGFPCVIIIYHYARIFLITRASHKRVRSKMVQSQATTYDLHKQKKELHLTRMMTVIFAVFILSYFPCTITGIIDWNTVLSKSFHMICAGTVYIGSALNPLIYGLMNRQFRQAYCQLLSCGTATTIKTLKKHGQHEVKPKPTGRRVSCPASLTVLHQPSLRQSGFKTIVQTPLLLEESVEDISCGSSDDPFLFRQNDELLDEPPEWDHREKRRKSTLCQDNPELIFLQVPPNFV